MYSDDVSPFRPRGEPNAVLRVMAVGFAVLCVVYAGVDMKRGADAQLQRSVVPAPRPAAARATAPRAAPPADPRAPGFARGAPHVPGHLPFEQQVAITSGVAGDAAWLYRQSAAPLGAGGIGGPAAVHAPPRRDACVAFDASIRQIDATTRRPLPATLQDHWRAERTALQSQRFAARC